MIYTMNYLLHVPKVRIRSVLKEIRRVLKPQGLFYMAVYGWSDFEGIWVKDTYESKRFFSFFSFFSDEEMMELVRSFNVEDFNIVKFQPETALSVDGVEININCRME